MIRDQLDKVDSGKIREEEKTKWSLLAFRKPYSNKR